jgi:FkbM family methyltransferase
MMVMEKLAEHSFEPSILTPEGWVLDGGCRGFKFARGMADRGMRVLAVDPDPAIADPEIHNVTFRRLALAITDGEANYVLGNGIGNFVSGEETPSYAKVVRVPTITLSRLMSEHKIGHFDLIKLDIEGAEYSVLMELPPGCCRQLSVEFHDFIGRNPEPEPEAY